MLTVPLVLGLLVALWMALGVHLVSMKRRAWTDLETFDLLGIQAWFELMGDGHRGVMFTAIVVGLVGPLGWHVRMLLWPLWMGAVTRRTAELMVGGAHE